MFSVMGNIFGSMLDILFRLIKGTFSIFRSTTVTIIFTVIMCLMIYMSFEVSKSDLVYAVDNTSNVVQSMKDFSASELGKDSARFMVDVGGNTIKGVNKYIMSEVGSSKATQGFDLILDSGFMKIFGISGNSVESIVDSCVRAIKNKI